MKSFVTGATGFVGRKLVSKLVEEFGAANVVCLIPPHLNELESSGQQILNNLGVKTICTDITTWQPLPEEIPDFDVVFHLAASTDSGAANHETNDRGTEHLIQTLGKQLNHKRFVYVSTTATIDRNGPANTPLNENSPCYPRTEYGRSKLRAERIVEQYSANLNYDFTILRFSTVYGFGTRPNGLFDVFQSWVRQGHILGRINWPGKTGLIFIDDAVDIVKTFAQNKQTIGETYCLVAESPSIGEIAQSMARAINKPHTPINLPHVFWNTIARCLRIPGLFAILPKFTHNILWRLSLIVTHGLWVESNKLHFHYNKPLIKLDTGIKDVMGVAQPSETSQATTCLSL